MRTSPFLYSMLIVVTLCVSAATAEEKVLFDFETDADVAAWSHLKLENKKLPGADEPGTKVELSTEGATSGKHALKITFQGGRWPTVTTAALPVTENWVAQKFVTFKADVTVTRPCLVGFRVVMENRQRDHQYPWAKTEICKVGKNELSQALGGWWTGMTDKDGKITALDVFMYSPQEGESILVDNVRLDTDRPARGRPRRVRFKVLGTDMTVSGIAELGKTLADKWVEPKANTPEDVEAAFRAKYDALKATHPKAVLAVFRDGEKGFDPADPEKVYAGWIDAHMNSHGPDSNIVGIAQNIQGWGSLEAFMRHRGLMARADFSSIPAGAKVLAAQLVLVREGAKLPEKPNIYVVEPCNRPWVEKEINGYEYAKDKYWKSVAGNQKPEFYLDDDPDFWPVYAAHGPFNGTAGVWDLTEAMKFWIEDGKPNHGFFFHGDSGDYTKVFSREQKDVKKRPTIMVVYEPGG